MALTISGFLEAMVGIAVRSENGNLVALRLQADRCINNESFCAADPEVWVEEDDILLRGLRSGS